jgi:hypothetical protein
MCKSRCACGICKGGGIRVSSVLAQAESMLLVASRARRYAPNEFASWSSASFAVDILSNTTANPGQGDPSGLAPLGLDPAPPSCERRLT